MDGYAVKPPTRTPTLPRAGWLIIPSLLIVRALLAVLPLSWRTEMVLSDVLTYFAPMVLSIVLALLLVMRARREGDRTGVMFGAVVALAVLALLVSEIHYTVYVVAVDPAGPGISVFERVLHLLAIAAMFILLVRLTRFGMLSIAQRTAFYLDVLAMAVIAWPVVITVWTDPITRGLPDSTGLAAVSGLYALFGVIMMVFTSIAGFSSSRRSRPIWERLIALAMWCYGLSLAVSPAFLSAQSANPAAVSGWLTLVYGSGITILAVGLLYRLFGTEPASMEPWPLPRLLSPRLVRFYPIITASALPVLGIASLVIRPAESAVPFARAVWALATILALRGWLGSVDQAGTRRQLAADAETGLLTRAVLERRIAEVVELSSEAGEEASFIVFDARRFRPVVAADRRSIRDSVAVMSARLVADLVPEGCEAFHITDNRFAVILEGSGPLEAVEYALKVCMAAARDPKLSASAGVSVCAGVSSFPRDGVNGGTLLAAAEVAASTAHGLDDGPVAVYGDEIRAITADEREFRARRRVQRRTVQALAQAVDARDPATRDHSTNVAELATGLAQVLGLDERRVQTIGLGALMHDIGKIGVPDEMLLSPRRISSDERREVELHCVLGERILMPARLDEVLPLVRWHHERWDGQGYPDGLAGEDIPLEARIVAVCDAFETMTTGRPYMPARSVEVALDEIEACAGTQFDPAVASAFLRMVRAMVGRPSSPR